jgi:hypothetical protein
LHGDHNSLPECPNYLRAQVAGGSVWNSLSKQVKGFLSRDQISCLSDLLTSPGSTGSIGVSVWREKNFRSECVFYLCGR